MKNLNPPSLEELHKYFGIQKLHGAGVGPYITPPGEKTLKDCYNHGCDHRVYGWDTKADHRWTYQQKLAYYDGYKGFDFQEYK